MKTIKDLNIDGKKVIIRCDFNVPIKDGKIVDDTRIKGALETIKYCIRIIKLRTSALYFFIFCKLV